MDPCKMIWFSFMTLLYTIEDLGDVTLMKPWHVDVTSWQPFKSIYLAIYQLIYPPIHLPIQFIHLIHFLKTYFEKESATTIFCKQKKSTLVTGYPPSSSLYGFTHHPLSIRPRLQCFTELGDDNKMFEHTF